MFEEDFSTCQEGTRNSGANVGANFGEFFGGNFASNFVSVFGNFVQQKGGANKQGQFDIVELFGETQHDQGQQDREPLRGKSASVRGSLRGSLRGFQRFLEVSRGFSEALSECHFPLRVAGPVARNRVAP